MDNYKLRVVKTTKRASFCCDLPVLISYFYGCLEDIENAAAKGELHPDAIVAAMELML